MSAIEPVDTAIERICLTVPDLEQGRAFYRDALSFMEEGSAGWCAPDRAALLGIPQARLRSITMRLGAQRLELLAFEPPGPAYPQDSTSSDLWFQHCALVVGDMGKAFAHLEGFSVQPITQGGPQVLPPNTGGVGAYKFRDPFGHPIELLWFPPGVGDPVWHPPVPAMIQGIDHTAIAVSDADRSARFYEQVLGFAVSSRSHNTGGAQSRLDAIAQDQVDVVALSPAEPTPHLELLGYRAGLRRPRPAGWPASHVGLTRTILRVSDVEAIERRLAAIDPGRAVRTGTWDGHPALAFEDPDGHALIVRAG